MLRSLQPLSKAHKYAHTCTATDKYILGSAGKDSACPTGYGQVDKANCGDAARSAGIVAGAKSQNSAFLEGNWDHAPAGCFIIANELTKSSGPRALWNGRSSGKNNGDFRVVCEHGGLKL